MHSAQCVTMMIMAMMVSLSWVGMAEGQPGIPLDCRSCNQPIDWDQPEYLCALPSQFSQTPRTYVNQDCGDLSLLFSCAMSGYPDVFVPLYPGLCQCPSNCSSSFRGVCPDSAPLPSEGQEGSVPASVCQCQPGYAGPDCSSISCRAGQTCFNRGKCMTLNGYDVCQCDEGYGGIDCALTTKPLPAIVPTAGYFQPQYTKKDSYGDDNPLWDESGVAIVWLELNPKDLLWLMESENQENSTYLPANMTFYNKNVNVGGLQVGMRLVGDVSRSFIKKSWKIDVAFVNASQRLYQQKVLDFKAGSMSPSFVRERATRDLLYSVGAKVQRMSYATLFINGLYHGVYLLMDSIDNVWLNSRFGNNNGGLWKVPELDFDIDLPVVDNRCTPETATIFQYSAENQFAIDNCAAIAGFVYFVFHSSDAQFVANLSSYLDVTLFLKTLAVEALTGNWDGIYHQNNFWMYYDVSTSPPLFRYFRQDLDMAFGCSVGWSSDPFFAPIVEYGDIFRWGDEGEFLIHRMLRMAPFRTLFSQIMEQLMQSYLSSNVSLPFLQRVLALHDMITPAVEQDFWHRLDFAYSFEQFLNNVQSQPIIRHYVDFNITIPTVFSAPFVEWTSHRLSSAQGQIELEKKNRTGSLFTPD